MRLQTVLVMAGTGIVGATLMLGGWSIASAQVTQRASGRPDVRTSIEIFRRLHQDLSKRHWSLEGVRLSQYRLPDQAFAEDAAARAPRTTMVFVPGPEITAYREIAFTTDIYVRSNFRRLPDGKAETSPEGFYLVCWKDGRIEQIPVGQARMYVLSKVDGETTYVPVFPGQAVYRDDLPLMPYMQLAKSAAMQP